MSYLLSEYCKENDVEFKSKIKLVYELIKDLDFTEKHRIYLLMDTWYGAAQLIMNALKEEIYSIVPLKKIEKYFLKK